MTVLVRWVAHSPEQRDFANSIRRSIMFRKSTLTGLVVLGCLFLLAFTPKALGQPVISVRDPQTGRRYVADPTQERRTKLERTVIDLRLRVDALNTQAAA